MNGHIDLFEAIVIRGPGHVVHAPLFRIDGGPLRRVNGGEVETGKVYSISKMDEWRAAEIMPLARAAAGVRHVGT